ncbi:phosphoribosyl-ATP diphosphatase [Sandaracinobacter sp. RS1-74]|uniref:phosphoribosyl-ATP diphosphatase n=1 Tax=Sandaracinobacteroides sayramensis TaxID=2913411 RepID=UPI001EDAE970|nr:phosphoribosyl-ATP diphosphatase [Sandaracinobacteroides sayramensis]MCG2842776.1 phosphoribosyl-ATP diphosphatase [Sandaracinobacteroides sayramensis]
MTDILDRLETLIAERLQQGAAESSYVARQAARGRLKLAEKVGEEAVETVIAAIAQDDEALIGEAADLIFHLLILLGERGISLDQVRAELERREGQSGLDEKAGRRK